jgi:hypothetical protein
LEVLFNVELDRVFGHQQPGCYFLLSNALGVHFQYLTYFTHTGRFISHDLDFEAMRKYTARIKNRQAKNSMITSKKEGSVCPGQVGSVCSAELGSIWTDQVGSVSAEFP